jgi:hypothetical protein
MKVMSVFQCMRLLWLAVVFTGLLGCENYLVVNTSTKFGLDISQTAKQPPKVVIGYKREETAIIPADHQNAESGKDQEQEDTYSVLGEFCVIANPSLWDFVQGLSSANNNVPDSLQIRSFFATGIAASKAAKTAQTRHYFTENVLKRTSDKQKEKRCF